MTPGSIQWLTPFYAIFPLFLIIVTLVFAKRRGQFILFDSQMFTHKIKFKHPLFELIPHNQHSQKKQNQWLQGLLFIWLGIMFAIALAQPVRIGDKLPDLPPERDIVMLVAAVLPNERVISLGAMLGQRRPPEPKAIPRVPSEVKAMSPTSGALVPGLTSMSSLPPL